MKRNNTSTQGSGVDNRFSTSLDLNDHSSVNKFILERLDDINENNQTAHSGEQLTFTIPQILTALVAVITIGGSGLAAWNNLNNQLITQKIGHKKGRNTLAVFRPTSTYENNPFWKGY